MNLEDLRDAVSTGFGHMSKRLDAQDKALAELQKAVEPIVRTRKHLQTLGAIALAAAATVAGGGLAAYALHRLGLPSTPIELSPPETANP